MNKEKHLKELINYLEEQLSNSYFHSNVESNINGYKCAINDLSEYLDKNYGDNPPKEGMLKCSSCGLWVEEDRIFEHKNGKSHLCFDCY